LQVSDLTININYKIYKKQIYINYYMGAIVCAGTDSNIIKLLEFKKKYAIYNVDSSNPRKQSKARTKNLISSLKGLEIKLLEHYSNFDY
jgi:hypothetical protein